MQKAFFNRKETFGICLVGFAVTGLLSWLFLKGIEQGYDLAIVRAKSMALLTVWSVGVTLYLTRVRSTMANVLTGAIATIAIILIQASGSLQFLKLAPLKISDWIQIGGLVVLAVALDWIVKRIRFERDNS